MDPTGIKVIVIWVRLAFQLICNCKLWYFQKGYTIMLPEKCSLMEHYHLLQILRGIQ